MRRAVAIGLLSFALALGGCSGDEGAGAPPVESVSARFEALSDVIVVNARDRLPLRSAVLVAPDGERAPAYSLDVTASPVIEPPPGEQILMATPGAPRVVTRLNMVISTALIRLPDANRYAKNWRDSRVELQFGDPGSGERTVTLNAPKPPP